MAQTDLTIANRALSALGARSGSPGTTSAISSFNQNCNEASQIALLYYPTRDDLMRAAHWNFAKKTAQLSLLKSAPGTPNNPNTGVPWSNTFPPPPWFYEYALPSDSLKMRQVKVAPSYAGGTAVGYPVGIGPGAIGYGGARGWDKFEVASDVDSSNNQIPVVLCNIMQALGVYTCKIENPALWDASFQECMVVALAGRLAMALTGDKQLAQMLIQQAGAYVQQARVSDGNEGTTNVDHIPDWIAIRGFQGDWFDGGAYIAGWDSPAWLGL
jgi:hypothetical protein